ncbi:MAG: guanylate kinase [Ktedonobacteraceae bacterium]
MQLETEQCVSQHNHDASLLQKQGLLFVLSAPSGTGKDSVIQALKEQGTDFNVVASVTTRAPRPGESEGNPYHFVSEEKFKQLVDEDELLEYAKVHGNWYGQPRQVIREHLKAGRDVLLKIDVQGAATVRRKVPEAIFIFLVPGSLEELEERLAQRDTETQEERVRRLADARKEMEQRYWYDYLVVNRQDHMQEAVEQLRAIMLAEHCRTQIRQIDV